MESLKEIIEAECPTVLCLAETHLRGDDVLDIPGYNGCLFRNEKEEKDGGGLLIDQILRK